MVGSQIYTGYTEDKALPDVKSIKKSSYFTFETRDGLSVYFVLSELIP